MADIISYSYTMTKAKFDGIILDIDGTIWNTTPVVAQAWNKAIEMSGLSFIKKVDAEILKKEFGKTMSVIADDLWPELNEQQRTELMKNCVICEHEAINANKENITYPGIKETIEEISAVCPFYIVSNCQDGYIELTMEKNGITDLIKDFECYGHTGKGKADNLKLLVQRNNLKAPVYVGDTKGDEEACKEAGIPFIWASYGFGTSDSHIAKLSSFDELKKIVL